MSMTGPSYVPFVKYCVVLFCQSFQTRLILNDLNSACDPRRSLAMDSYTAVESHDFQLVECQCTARSVPRPQYTAGRHGMRLLCAPENNARPSRLSPFAARCWSQILLHSLRHYRSRRLYCIIYIR